MGMNVHVGVGGRETERGVGEKGGEREGEGEGVCPCVRVCP